MTDNPHSLKLVGHGTNGSDGIESGIHLRWAFNYKLGFPPCFKLYRRASNLENLHLFNFEQLGDRVPVPYQQYDSDEQKFLFVLESATALDGTEVSSVDTVTVQLPNDEYVNAISFSGELKFKFNKAVSRVELGFQFSPSSKFEIIALTKQGPYYPQTVLGTTRGFRTVAFDADETTGLILRGEGIVFGKLRLWTCGKGSDWIRINEICGCGLPINHEGTNYTRDVYPAILGNDLAVTLCRLGVMRLRDTEFSVADFLNLKALLLSLLPEGVLVPWGWILFPTTPNDQLPEENDNELEYSKYDFLLAQSHHVFYAKVLGLYFVDKDIAPNEYYDYKVTARWPESNLRRLEHEITFEAYEVGHTFFYSPILDENVVMLATSPPVVVEQDFPTARTEQGMLITTTADFTLINFIRPVTEVQLGIVNLEFSAGQPEIIIEGYKNFLSTYVDKARLTTDKGLVRIRAPKIDSLKIYGSNFVLSRLHYEFEPYPVALQESIICGVRQESQYPLEKPTGLQANLLPGGSVNDSDGNVTEQPYIAGLRWDVNENENARLISIAPILYHVQKKLPDGTNIWPTEKSPVFISPSTVPREQVSTPDGWPELRQFYLDAIEGKVKNRYRIAAKDLFGRISRFTGFVSYRASETRPPHPIEVSAQFLDYSTYDSASDSFSDSTLNDADKAWLRAHKENAIAVRWKWPPNLQLQAADVDGFNVFYKQGWLNNYSGEITSAYEETTLDLVLTREEVEKYPVFGTSPVTIPVFKFKTALKLGETVPADGFRLCWLSQGASRYLVVKNTGGSAPTIWALDQRPLVHYTPQNLKGFGVAVNPESGNFIDYKDPRQWTDTSVSHTEPNNGTGAEDYAIYIVNPAFPDPAIASEDKDKVRYAQIAVNSQVGAVKGSVSPAASIMAVYRTAPATPNSFAAAGPEAEALKATPANVHGKSSFALRWDKLYSSLRHHVFRALDDTLFSVDNKNRPRPGSFYTDFKVQHPEFDPADVDVVAAIRHQPKTELVRQRYSSLNPAQLQILASLPDNENAFTQLTGKAINENDASYEDRVTDIPDPMGGGAYVPDPANVLLYLDDELEGRGINQYFYALKTLDTNGLSSFLSTATLPVECPKVTPPPQPVLTSVLGEDRQIRIKWAKNPGADIAGYLLYRAEERSQATDWRRMQLVRTNETDTYSVEINGGLPGKEFEFVDESVVPRKEHSYAVVAVSLSDDGKFLRSRISQPLAGQAHKTTPPEPPAINLIEWVKVDDSGNVFDFDELVPAGETRYPAVRLEWAGTEPDLQYLVQFSADYLDDFKNATDWMAEGINSLVHRNSYFNFDHTYRILVVDRFGNRNTDYLESLITSKGT